MAENKKPVKDYEMLLRSQERTHFYKMMELVTVGLDNCGVCIYCEDCPRVETCILKKTSDEIERRIQNGEFEENLPVTT